MPRSPIGPTPSSTLPLVAVGGAVGALLRWGVVEAAGDRAALAVLVCNVVGSLVLGALAGSMPPPGAFLSADDWGRRFRRQRLLGTGVCGGLTTLSTVAVDAADRLDDGRWGDGAGGLAATVLLTVVAAAIGLMAVRRGRSPVSTGDAR